MVEMFSQGLKVLSFWGVLFTSPVFAANMDGHGLSSDAAPARAHVIQASAGNEQNLTKARDFIADLTDKGIGFLKNKEMSDTARSNEFRKLLVSKFDIDRIGRFSMGRYWKQASAAQQAEYVKLFKDMLVSSYSEKFKNYQGQEMKVVSARAEGDSDIIVSSKLVESGRPDVSVDWRVRQSGATYKVIDVIVEGVSMAVTQRSEFASVIQRGGGGVDVLIAYLKGNK